MEQWFLIAMLGLSCSVTTISRGQQVSGGPQQRYARHLAEFEADTRAELSRTARDTTLTGEQKIIHIEQWFTSNALRIEEINRLADTLDRLAPITRPLPPARPADRSPEGTAAESLHALSRRFSEGDIDASQFHLLRAPVLAGLAASVPSVEERRVNPAVASPEGRLPGPHASLEELAEALHAHNRYLAGLPPEQAAAIRADPQSPVNLIPSLIEARSSLAGTNQPSESQQTSHHPNVDP